jgi:hypothetical protein
MILSKAAAWRVTAVPKDPGGQDYGLLRNGGSRRKGGGVTETQRTPTADVLPGAGLAIGAGAGAALGIAIAGATGIPFGVVIGAALGLLVGGAMRAYRARGQDPRS